MLLAVVAAVLGSKERAKAQAATPPPDLLTGVVDDGASTVFIPQAGNRRQEYILELMAKKFQWEKHNPDKEIVAFAIIPWGDGNAGGMFIHYRRLSSPTATP
ncbi:hypothetical protein HY933_04405 [Candidatus Falkowbacteria bacterium]|nr:hypothetical protein [Candidatus Falkowbacteria bacterium]